MSTPKSPKQLARERMAAANETRRPMATSRPPAKADAKKPASKPKTPARVDVFERDVSGRMDRVLVVDAHSNVWDGYMFTDLQSPDLTHNVSIELVNATCHMNLVMRDGDFVRLTHAEKIDHKAHDSTGMVHFPWALVTPRVIVQMRDKRQWTRPAKSIEKSEQR